MTQQERAVALVTDIIAIIDAGKVVPRKGTYVRTLMATQCNPDGDARAFLSGYVCRVCALGAAVVARVLARNELTNARIGLRANSVEGAYIGDRPLVVNALAECFDAATCSYIETAFEGWNVSGDLDISQRYGEMCQQWMSEYPSATDRLKAICQRIQETHQFTLDDIGTPRKSVS